MKGSTALSIISVTVGILGLAVACYQGFERQKLSSIMRSSAWSLYLKASNANGHGQQALRLYKEAYKDHINAELLELLSKADAFGQEVHKDTVEIIRLTEPKFDREHIDQWISSGKIQAPHRNIFNQLCTEDYVADLGTNVMSR